LGIAWERLSADESALAGTFARATAHMGGARTPYAFVVAPGTIEAAEPWVPSPAPPASISEDRGAGSWPSTRLSRRDAIAAVQGALAPADVLLATTGYTGREMTALTDRPNQLAMVGSMGCVGSLGLGLAAVLPERRVVVLDGDGAALMRLGALATVGAERPPNLVHVLLDNEAHESTGAQPTAATTTDLGAVARACGYPRVVRVGSAAGLHDLLADGAPGLTFAHVKTAVDRGPAPSRPPTPPAEAAARLIAWLGR
jgi:phosphonopyruvate decarboxylase